MFLVDWQEVIDINNNVRIVKEKIFFIKVLFLIFCSKKATTFVWGEGEGWSLKRRERIAGDQPRTGGG